MAQTYNKMKIDIKESITDIITAKQNDSNSRFLDVYLYDGGVPINLTGHELRIYMLKPDGTEIFNNGTITEAASGRCQFELTDQALGAYGKLQCEITIWKDNVQILTSPTFDIHVVKSLRTNGSIESSNEYGALVVLYQNLYEAIDLMTTMVEQFGEPGEVADAADIATFWQMLEYLYDVNKSALANASVQGVIDLIGATDNTGGSATAGTLMAKENAIIGNLLNGTYGLNALQTLINKDRPWYATHSETNNTLKSLTSPVAVTSNANKVLMNFYAPVDGVYVSSFTAQYTGNNANGYNRRLKLLVKDYSALKLDQERNTDYYADYKESDAFYTNENKTITISASVFLQGGRRYGLYVNYGGGELSSGEATLTVNTAKITYAKTYVNT